MTQPVELVHRGDPDGDTVLYACALCGTVYSPRAYGTRDGAEHARSAAADCPSCRMPEQERRETDEAYRRSREDRIAKATEVTDLGFCFSDRTDDCYPSVEDAADAGETGVFGSIFHPFHVDAGSVVGNILDSHPEECDESHLDGLDDLYAAIDAFNARQKLGSYSMDEKRWQRIEQNHTFAMIKPDATARGIEEDMIADIEAAGFRVKDQRRETLAREAAEFLYDEHRQRDHFRDLVDYTISGDVVLLRLESDHDDTATAFRKLMGATDRTKAEPGTLRAKYAVGYRENSVHGSDSAAAAVNELSYFFK